MRHLAAGAVVAFAVVFGGEASRADDRPLPAAPPAVMPKIDGDGGSIHPPTGVPEARDEQPESRTRAPRLEHRSILLDLASVHPVRWDTVGELTGNEKPSLVSTTYHGIQGVIVRKIFSYYRTFAADTINARVNLSSDTREVLDRRIAAYWGAQQDQDNGGRWWERPWDQSLVPARGGAPELTTQVAIGQEIEIIRLGEFALTTEGRIRGTRLSLFFDDERVFESFEPRGRALEPGLKAPPPTTGSPRAIKERDKDRPGERTLGRDESMDLGIDWFASDVEEDLERSLCGTSRDRCHRTEIFHTPHGNFLTGDHWNVDFQGGLECKVPPMNHVGSGFQDLSLEFDLSIFPDVTRQQWRILQLSVDLRPNSREYSAMVVFQIANW